MSEGASDHQALLEGGKAPSAAVEPKRRERRVISRRRWWAIRVAALARWLHIYLSMIGLGAILFFSVTGLTLNHPTWFGAGEESRVEATGQVNLRWVALPATTSEGEPKVDPAAAVAKLEVVEHLRSHHGVGGALAEFRVDDYECFVGFKGPGYAADAFIERATGKYTLTETRHGAVAILNDLHKGRDTGPVWSVVIDVSAVVMTLVSLTGLVLLFYLKLRRRPGVLVAIVGAAIVGALAVWWAP